MFIGVLYLCGLGAEASFKTRTLLQGTVLYAWVEKAARHLARGWLKGEDSLKNPTARKVFHLCRVLDVIAA